MLCTASDLHVAIYAQNTEVVNECVKNPNIINSFWRGCTPVSSAIYRKRYDILQILVSSGANVNLCTRNSATQINSKMEPPLFAACRLRDYTALNILLTSSCLEINQRDFFGRTALWAASRYCTADIVEVLLNRGAKLNTCYAFCKRHPMNGALQQSNRNAKSVIQLLIRRGSLLDPVCEESPLKWALKCKDRETLCLLVSAGYKVTREDWLSIKVTNTWEEDEPFRNWIESLCKNPTSLKILAARCIRNTLSVNWSSLTPHLVKQLQLPNSLNDLLLLQN